MADRKKAKKVLGIIGTVLLYLFMALCFAAVILTIFSKRNDDGAVSMFGHEMRIVLSGSMEKSDMTDVSGYRIKDIPVKSLIITENVPEDEEKAAAWYAELEVGDVLTFRYLVGGGQETITHRIIAIEPQRNGFKLILRGDNRTENEGEQVIYTDEATNPEPANYVIGKVVFTSSFLGNIVYILQRPIGIALVVIVPAAIIILFQIIRIISVFSAERRKKEQARETEKNNEIELLKKRLADLEQEKGREETVPAESAPEAPMSEEELPKTQEGGTMSEDAVSQNEDVRTDITASAEAAPDAAQSNSGSDGDLPADKSSKEE